MTFGWALNHIKEGTRVARHAWTGGRWLQLCNDKKRKSEIVIVDDGKAWPWAPERGDLLADDWHVVEAR